MPVTNGWCSGGISAYVGGFSPHYQDWVGRDGRLGRARPVETRQVPKQNRYEHTVRVNIGVIEPERAEGIARNIIEAAKKSSDVNQGTTYTFKIERYGDHKSPQSNVLLVITFTVQYRKPAEVDGLLTEVNQVAGQIIDRLKAPGS